MENENINYNIEDTAKLMTGSGKGGTDRKFMILIIVLGIAVVAAGIGILVLKAGGYDEQISIAEKHLQEGDYVSAEAAYLKAVDMKGRSVKARAGLAYTYALERKFADAGNEYRGLYDQTGEEKYSDAAALTDMQIIPADNDLIPVEGLWDGKDVDETLVTAEMRDKLMGFISYLPYYVNRDAPEGISSNTEKRDYYNCETAADHKIMFAMMWNAPCIDYYAYTVDFERQEPYKDDIKDPLGRASDDYGNIMMYYKTNADAVNWAAKNVFNESDDQIEEEINKDEGFYLYEGYYYLITGGIGWETSYEFNIDSIKMEDGYFIIEYTQYNNTMDQIFDTVRYRVKMKYKVQDGFGYWSLYERDKI